MYWRKFEIDVVFLMDCVLSSNGNSGGVDLWWNDLDVFVLSFPSHHIHAIMLDEHKNLSWHDVGIFNWLETSNTHLA